MLRVAVVALICLHLRAELPSHDPVLFARLITGISTRTAQRGDAVRAVVVSAAVDNGRILIPQGSLILGRVVKVHRVGAGLVHERSSLKIDVRSWRSGDGVVHPLTARLMDVDNAREQVTADGRIIGILAAGGPPGFLLGLWKQPGDELLSRTALGLAGITGYIGQRFR